MNERIETRKIINLLWTLHLTLWSHKLLQVVWSTFEFWFYLWIRGEHPIHILHSLLLDAQSHQPMYKFVTCTTIEVNIICNEWATLTILSNPCHSFSKVKMHVTPIVGWVSICFEDFIPTYKITNLLCPYQPPWQKRNEWVGKIQRYPSLVCS